MLRNVARAGYHYVILWSVDTLGWRGASIPQIVDRCLVGTTSGAIFVLHVGGISKDIDAIPQIVEGVRARGYRFATVGELLL